MNNPSEIDAGFPAPDEEEEEGVERVAPFRIILTAACAINDLASLPGESVEHARNDATLAICQAFHQALHSVNEEEGTDFSMFDFRIEKVYLAHEIPEDHLFG